MPTKRKKTQAHARESLKAQRRGKARTRAVVPGVTRTAGFYGRYAGADAELKFHDLDIDDPVVAANDTIVAPSCNLIAQGVTESQRIGRKCVLRKIAWRYNITIPATAVAADASDVVRIILYLDSQCNGAAATTAGILESDEYLSFNNLANKGRFRTLMDRYVPMSCQAGSGRGSTDTLSYGEDTFQDAFYKDVNIPIEYDSTTGAITEIRSNNLGVLLLGKSGKLVFASKMRLRFEG